MAKKGGKVIGLFLVAVLWVGALVANETDLVKRWQDLGFESCSVEGYGGAAYCGYYEVWENRELQKGRKIKLYAVILPATGEQRAPDPLFFFAGGPGDAITGGAGFIPRFLAKIHEKRDFVFVDQRGTGRSHPLHCDPLGPPDSVQTYLVDMYPPAYVDACRKKLEAMADLTQYTTAIAADDIHEIRAALGYDRINLMGISYGTRAVQVYMQRHEESARAAILNGVVPFQASIPETFAQDTERAMALTIEACAADETCNKAYPTFAEDLKSVLARIKQNPVELEVENPFTKKMEKVSLSHGPFIAALRALLYGEGRASQIPMMISKAAQGDFAPITLNAARYFKAINEAISDGLYLCVTCAEDLPYFDHAKAAKAAEGTFLGDYRVSQQASACTRWPRAKIPAEFRALGTIKTPTLMLSGELDPVTPPSWADQAINYLPNHHHVLAPNRAHGVFDPWEGCLQDLFTRFIEEASVKNLDSACVKEAKRPPFHTE